MTETIEKSDAVIDAVREDLLRRSHNELSARYRELPEEFYVPKPEHIGVQSKDNKQGRDIAEGSEAFNNRLARENLCVSMRSSNELTFENYRYLLNSGVPRELARSVLPVATYSHMFATVNLLNLMKFWGLRSDSHAQYEIRVYSDAMRGLVKPLVPVCVQAWEASL